MFRQAIVRRSGTVRSSRSLPPRSRPPCLRSLRKRAPNRGGVGWWWQAEGVGRAWDRPRLQSGTARPSGSRCCACEITALSKQCSMPLCTSMRAGPLISPIFYVPAARSYSREGGREWNREGQMELRPQRPAESCCFGAWLTVPVSLGCGRSPQQSGSREAAREASARGKEAESGHSR